MARPAHRNPPATSRRSVAGMAVAVATAGAAALTGCGGVAAPSSSGAGRSPGAAHPSPAPAITAPLAPVTVTSVSPTAGVAPGAAVTVTFSQPLAPGAADPTLSPPVAGAWSQSGDSLTFTPAGGWVPDTTETLTVPAGVTAHEGSRTATLASAYHSTITVGAGSLLRLQELLAELQYLPLSFAPSAPIPAAPATTAPSSSAAAATTAAPPPAPAVTAGLDGEATDADAVRTTPVPGTFAWRYPSIPASLSSLWTPGHANVITKGAVMAFEADHGMTVDGTAGPDVWTALTGAVAARQVDTRPYNYLEVNETGSEELQAWSAGKVVFTAPVNTGVPGAATQPGTFPVYERFRNQIMKGTDVDGTKYAVPVSWIAYFNGGDAVHGYPRASYGYPQSNGCVELPIPAAETLWTSSQGYDSYGTLVHVSAGPAGT